MDCTGLCWVRRSTNCLSPHFWRQVFFYDFMESGLSLFRQKERQFICNRISLKSSIYPQYCHIESSFCRVSLYGNSWKMKVFLRITNTFIESTHFYFNFIAICAVYWLINSHAFLYWPPRLLPISFITCSCHLAIYSFEKPHFEVKISRSLICTIFSQIICWGNDAYLYFPCLGILIWNFLLLPIVMNRPNDGRNKR